MVTTRLHNTATDSDLHTLIRWTVADATARLALSVVAGDIGKRAFQEDTKTFWDLADNSPMTWSFAGTGGGSGDLDSVLTIGNTTGGNNIMFSTGDNIGAVTSLAITPATQLDLGRTTPVIQIGNTMLNTNISIGTGNTALATNSITTTIVAGTSIDIQSATITVGSAADTGIVLSQSGDTVITYAAAAVQTTVGSGYLGVGATTASTGTIRLPASGSIYGIVDTVNNPIITTAATTITFGNASDCGLKFTPSSDLAELTIAGTNTLTVGVGYWTLGATASAASAGSIRLPANTTLIEIGTGNLTALGITGAYIFYGNTAGAYLSVNQSINEAAMTVGAGVDQIKVVGGSTHTITTTANSVVNMTVGNGYWTHGAVASAATAGAIRLPNAVYINALNAAGNANIQLIGVNASDNVIIGSATGGAASADTGIVISDGSNVINFYAGTTLATQLGQATQTLYASGTVAGTVGAGYYTVGVVASAAASGSIRLPAGGSIVALNSSDRQLIAESGGTVHLGTPTTAAGGWNINFAAATSSYFISSVAQFTVGNGYWTHGVVASAATAGMIRMASGALMTVNISGTDRPVIGTDTVGMFFGNTTASQTGMYARYSNSQIQFYSGGLIGLSLLNSSGGSVVAFGTLTSITYGSTAPATTGTFNSMKNQTYMVRNEGNSADLTLWAQTATNVLALAADFTTVNIGASAATIRMGDAAGNNAVRCTSSLVDIFAGGFSAAQFSAAGMAIGFNAAAPLWIHNVDATAATTGKVWTIRAQDVSGTGAAVGGNIKLSAGNGTANNAAGGHAWVLGGSKTGTGTVGNICFGQALPASWQAGEEIIFLGDMTTAPTGNPASGGYMWSQAGALYWRGSSGNVTVIAPA